MRGTLEAISRYAALLASSWIPHRCLVCENLNERGKYFCHECLPEVAQISSGHCWKCQEIIFSQDESFLCLPCSKDPYRGVIRSFGTYNGRNRAIIHAAKYDPCISLCREIGRIMNEHLPLKFNGGKVSPHYLWEFIVPTPSSLSGLRKRGFSPAQAMASQIAPQVTHLDTFFNPHKRAASTSLKPRQRLYRAQFHPRSLNHSFLQGARVLLIDDVLTTGTTIRTLQRILYSLGCSRVDVYTFLRSRHFQNYRQDL